MKLVVFGLSISSSWGNGHATLWRGLVRALAALGVDIVFFERDQPFYAGARDLERMPQADLVLYPDWAAVVERARREVHEADAAIVTSFCPDALVATQLIADAARPIRVFYDLDTPVTLDALRSGDDVAYIGPDGLAPFDLVLSFTGGRALGELLARLGARRVAPLYGHVDPDVHRPAEPQAQFRADLSYIGTFAPDRQPLLQRFFIEAAKQAPGRRFVIAGAQYPADFPWVPNIFFVHHLEAAQHPAFFASTRLTLNITRRAMAEMGWCPSGRLFEAAACGAAILSDTWPGIEEFFAPGTEILIARSTVDAMAALDQEDGELRAIGRAAQERVLAEHTSVHRARELLALLEGARRPAEMAPVADLEV